MSNTDTTVGTGSEKTPLDAPGEAGKRRGPELEYHAVFVDSPNIVLSLFRQIRDRLREPKITVPAEYYRGEAALPVVEMRAWYRDFPAQIRQLPGITSYLLLRAGRRLHLLPKRVEVPDIWQDYQAQPASWLNSLLVHAVVLAALILPFVIHGMVSPANTAPQEVVTLISPYLSQLPASAKKAGGGGGGGDRTPIPASKGAAPKFAREQFTPQMAAVNYGDPQSINSALSNGPGSGGGIGSGNGTGIGPGSGAGLGPGEGGGTGGGPFSVGGNVSAPIPIYQPDPPYSEEARKAKYQGTVVLSIIVDAQGDVHNVQVVKPLGLGLDEEAVASVKTWKF